MPPFVVQYYCPSRGQVYQGQRSYSSLQAAAGWCVAMKPHHPLAWARVVDARGVVVFQI
jgi:hypothetical protein